ncbi:MAG TPA: glucose-6-phosphate dehydrogenase assembly protein OpcA [Candidatus Rubrimentiphilum sp.]|nr:glucose-6-phosphate dehydrogenase assembly protein OpcA [Candidatus Rubrimentiphilum sp.]
MTAINTVELLDELSERRRDRPGVSTSTLNVVAFIDDPERLERIISRLETFTLKHPLRTIVLDACGTRERRVKTSCTQIDDTVLTQSEEIVLGIDALEPDELRSVVHDLLIPHVGCAIFWAGKDLSDARFGMLRALAQTIVVDCSRAADSQAAMHQLAQIAAAEDHAMSDLSYLRLLPWQDMVAQFFDDAELAAQLPAITRLEIVSGSDPEAYYLAGWLASRLQWKPCGDHELCNPQGTTINVAMTKNGEPRRVYSVVLRSKACEFRAELDPSAPDLVCLTVSGNPSRERRCAPLVDVDLVSLVEQAMLVPRRDPVFRGALDMGCAILDSAG